MSSSRNIAPGFEVPATDVWVGKERRAFSDVLGKGRAVVFGVPGAFTGTCNKQLPGFAKARAELKEAGVDVVACVSVNDNAVMGAWGTFSGVEGDDVVLVADFDASLTRALGTGIDLSAHGLGLRSVRFAAVVEGGVVKQYVEEASPADLKLTSAEAVLALLRAQ